MKLKEGRLEKLRNIPYTVVQQETAWLNRSV